MLSTVDDKPPVGSDIRTMDLAHHMHPFASISEMQECGVRVIDRAEGVYIFDDEGKRYLDAFAGLWCVNVGYGRSEIAQTAYDQINRLAFYNTFFGTTTEPAARLAERICRLAGPGMDRVFFTNSGSEAHDTWLRLASVYWNARGLPDRKIIISRKNAYHGSTVAAANLGGMEAMHQQIGMTLKNIIHIGQPYWYGEGEDLSPDEFGLKRARELEDTILEVGPENVSAFVAEPIQGTGGIIIPPATYWPEISRICKKYDILLVADEVICGFGRLGSWFGFQHFGLEPDFCTIAKGLSSGYAPIAGVIVNQRISKALIDKEEGFNHGFTYSGHPVSAAIALTNLDIIERENLVERVRSDIGPYFSEVWSTLANHPMVGEAVSLGLLGAIQITLDKSSRKRFSNPADIGMIVRNFCMQRGLVVRASADRILVSPAFIITRDQVDAAVKIIQDVLDFVHQELSS